VQATAAPMWQVGLQRRSGLRSETARSRAARPAPWLALHEAIEVAHAPVTSLAVLLGGETLGDPLGFLHHRAQGPEHDVGAFADNLGLAEGQGGGLGFDGSTGAGAATVSFLPSWRRRRGPGRPPGR